MKAIAFMVVLALLLLSTAVLADVPGMINYQGILTDEYGVALDTTVDMTFTIYTDSTGGTQVWSETQPAVEVDHGLFNVLLGRVNAISDTVFNGVSRWLGVQVESDPELEPRQRIVAAGYAFRATGADTAEYARSATAASDGDWTIAGSNMYSAVSGNVGIGTASPQAKLQVKGALRMGSGAAKYEIQEVTPYSGGGWKDYIDYGGIGIGSNDGTQRQMLMFTDGAGSNNIFTVATSENGGSSWEADFVVQQDGNVGIGTSSPSARLDVNGDVNTDSLYTIGGNPVLSAPGTQNVFAGVDAGLNNTGSYGTFIGYQTGKTNQGSNNVFIGCAAGSDNTEGDYNTFVGRAAGLHNIGASSNTFVGSYTGFDNTTGEYNTFVGNNAGHDNTTAHSNTFIGMSAGHSNETGYSNTFLGTAAGLYNTEGYYNTFVGSDAGYSNETGDENAFVGYKAGYSNTVGNDNTLLGPYSGYSNETGNENTFVGGYAGYNNIGASFNTFVGLYTGFANTTGQYNTFLGNKAGRNNTTAHSNTFVGMSAGHNNETGNSNTFLGTAAGIYNAEGYYNTFVGSDAGYRNETGDENTFVGYKAGHENTTGQGNVFLGFQAGYNETDSDKLYIANGSGASDVLIYGDFSTGQVGIGTTSPSAMLDVDGDVNTDSLYKIGGSTVLSTEGSQNVFVGAGAGGNNTGGYATFVGASAGLNNQGGDNVFVGRRAGYSNSTGGSNTYLGQAAGYSNTEGSDNTFLGSASGYKNTTGSDNTFLGRHAGYSNITGTGNVFVGHKAGYYETGSNKLYIANDKDNSDVLIYGDFSTGKVGIGTMVPTQELHVVGNIYCTGKLTSVGGNDPPYVLYNKESRAAIIDRVAEEVPEDKQNGAVLFWNGQDKRFEVYLPEDGEFRDLDGNLLSTVKKI